MSSLAVSEIPFTERSAYRPLITQRRCRCCTHPEREALESDIIEAKIVYKELARKYDVSITSVFNHKMKHISKMLDRVQEDYGIIEPKKILARIQQRSSIAHDRYLADPERAGHGRLAVEHDTVLLKATGNWRESRDITLGGSIQLTAADKADADYLAYLREYPIDEPGRNRLEHYMAWAERRLMGELQPAMLDTTVGQGEGAVAQLARESCTDGET